VQRTKTWIAAYHTPLSLCASFLFSLTRPLTLQETLDSLHRLNFLLCAWATLKPLFTTSTARLENKPNDFYKQFIPSPRLDDLCEDLKWIIAWIKHISTFAHLSPLVKPSFNVSHDHLIWIWPPISHD